MTAAIYLADLRHNFSGVLANDCMPLGVAYVKAVLDRDLPEAASSRLFAYPDRLLEALEREPPDVLMLSNYMWNEALSFHFARVAKRRRPDTLVVMGGPNIPLEADRQIAYVAAHPEIDVYVLGEGEPVASEIVRQFLDAGKSPERLAERELPSSIYRRDGALVRTPPWERHPQIDEVPSPWLTGCLDEFFDGRLAPLLETNRSCPFQCTFCVQGVRWYTKVHYFSIDRLREEIDYIGRRIRERSPAMGMLRIADSNYGMFERDAEISAFIGEAQRKYGWPTYIDATTGKNRPERVIESLERVGGALVLYQSVQSLDDETLRNIKRSNISKDAYEQVMIHVRGRGLRSLSDLILGLPGETLESHRRSIADILDSGTHEMHNFQAMMLKGSELETLESRRRHRFDTRFRLLPKNYGVYGGDKVFDVDEIVVATGTMTFDDYLEARKVHLACSLFWNNSWFEDAVTLALSFGIARSEWLFAMRRAMERDDGAIGRLVADFERETRNELFPTREACVEFYGREENFARLLTGEIGDNLMYKYRAIASFFRWPDACRVALGETHRLLVGRGAREAIADFDTLWSDFACYVELKHAHGTTADTLLAPATALLSYDVRRWLADGMPRDSAAYRLPASRRFVFELSPQATRELEAAVRTWSTSLVGLTKGVTRIRAAAQVRDCWPVAAAAAGEAAA